MKQTVRIIGGKYKGKKIHFPAIEGLRPTPDRVRETLFNWLMHDIAGAHCLDAFAGSGALGLEAYSRGAEEVVFLEAEPRAWSNLKKNITSFDENRLSVFKANALSYFQKAGKTFNIIFLDPPFAKGYLPQCLAALEKSQILLPEGLLYMESEQEITVNEQYWQQLKLKKAGHVVYALYKKIYNTNVA
ncbi:16S rRNA (guanine(966)-N(2))-methyltransferase RsmD [Legionella londiniensis]|uniref:Ribosomal RNA small subunit methyltransferase D n=1 Tax=Legionella londiniensis TaxID=45068 RepID=A0A0W0VHP3_9GAMM|nr:16S rRNA (guanine(966)-N(2))-methyltransferase RsmD [Legionella londiniensis]KTD19664.1 methyltransferase [Legionella londiniensis]STX92426.1 methyltransferase [Legionella londiniensis]